MLQRKPLIYLYGLVPGVYLPVWPVFLIEDDPAPRTSEAAKPTSDRMEQRYHGRLRVLDGGDPPPPVPG